MMVPYFIVIFNVTAVTKHHVLTESLNPMHFIDAPTQEALTNLSTLYTSNTVTSRRTLRGDLEKRAALVNRQFLNALGAVNQVANFQI